MNPFHSHDHCVDMIVHRITFFQNCSEKSARSSRPDAEHSPVLYVADSNIFFGTNNLKTSRHDALRSYYSTA
jgi:hypothetical protein